MHVVVYTYFDNENWQEKQKLYIDNKLVQSVGGGEPEDAIIGRDLVGCNDILNYMKKAVESVKNGEEFTYEVKECTEEEWEVLSV